MKAEMPLVPLEGSVIGEDDKNVCDITVGDKDLGTIEYIVVAFQDSGASALGCVRTSIRLGQGRTRQPCGLRSAYADTSASAPRCHAG